MPQIIVPDAPRPKPTGRFLVMFHPDSTPDVAATAFKNAVGMQTFNVQSEDGIALGLDNNQAGYLEKFKVAVVSPGLEGRARLVGLSAQDGVLQVRSEFYMFAIGELNQRYHAWLGQGIRLLTEHAEVQGGSIELSPIAPASAPFFDTQDCTWGITAVGARTSGLRGGGIKVAVLDTGLDLSHPDFEGRSITTKSFVAGEDSQDLQGHGTHTAGTIAGPLHSQLGRRYGVAPDVELYVGKVLNSTGSGREADILQGINWAIDQKCAVISMSLGRPTVAGEQSDPLYDEVGNAALREGALIVAAAGNESAREYNFIAPVGAPANSKSILAVAAVDAAMQVANFSCGSINLGGGEVNVSAPGVSVYSSFPRPQLSRNLQGTSMACPHVAGIAALWAQSDPSLRGMKLWAAIEGSCLPIGSAADFGKGLVRAPESNPIS